MGDLVWESTTQALRVPPRTYSTTVGWMLQLAIILASFTSLVISQQDEGLVGSRGKPSISDVELYEPQHYSPDNLSGGRGGGTKFRLLGNDLLNPDGSFDSSISVTLAGKQAKLIPFFSTATQLVVETPAKPAGFPDCCHSFKVMNRNGEVENRIPSNKQFKYDDRATPYLYGIVPSAAAPGDEVKVLGNFRWWRLRMDTYPPTDPRKLVPSVHIGPFRCLLPWSDNPEDAELDNYQYSISCRVPESALPGYYNVSVTIGDIFGSTVPWKPYYEKPQPGYGSDRAVSTYWPSLTDAPDVHMMQILPKIDTINVKTGSLAGGQLVQVGGHGFGKVTTDVNVEVDGLPCKVLSVDSKGVTCLTAPGTSGSRQVYQGGAGVKLEYYAENSRSISGNYTVTHRYKVPHLNMGSNSTAYRVHMDTIFTAPFSGVGYFIGNYDDFTDMTFTMLGANGTVSNDSMQIISSDYTGRSWTRYSGQKSQDMNFTKGERYLVALDHGNYGGPGYLDLALVHRNAPPSWSSEKGEQHTLSLQCNFTGQKQRLDLGPVANGTFQLSIGFTDFEGRRQLKETRAIDVESSDSSINYAADRIGVHLTSNRNVTAAGNTVLELTFTRPSVDGTGYTVDLRGVNFTCSGRCTARTGDRAEVIKSEDSFDWNTTLAVTWNGRESPVRMPTYLIDSDRSAVHTEALAIMQAIPGVPVAFHNARQSAGGLHARVNGNIFDGATIKYTWPAYLGALQGPSGSSMVSVNGTVQGPGSAQYEVTAAMDPAITDVWHHPIEASVFSMPESQPQVIVHVQGVRAMCGAAAGCSYTPAANNSAVLTSVDVADKQVNISGTGFGTQVGGQQQIAAVSIGSTLCLTENGTWTDTDISCTLETKLLPGINIVKVHVAGKGFAASSSEEPVYVSSSLDAPITASLRGSFGGGWPLQFNSSSSQLGKRPTRVYLRFSSNSSSHIAEVYMLPDPKGLNDRIHAIVCSSTLNSSSLPVVPFLGLQPVKSKVMQDQGNSTDSASISTTAQQEPTRMPPWQAIAEEFNITGLPSGCRYYAGRGLAWSLVEGQLVMPAPPQGVFAALHRSAGATQTNSTSRRRLAQASSEDFVVQADLVVNSQSVNSSQMEYDASAGPNVTSVAPVTISAAVSQVITVMGEGFSTDRDNTRVWVGDRECYVRSANASAIVCRARGGGTFGVLPITVRTGGEFAAGNVSVTGELHISSISKAYGSLAGGSVIEISGAGFADELGVVTTNFVSIGLPPAAPCRVLASNYSHITCQTEPAGRMHAGAIPEILNPLEISVSGIYAQCRAPPACTPGCNSTAAAAAGSKCCSFSVPDPENTEPPAFIDDNQGIGADNCSFYYTKHATPNVTAFSAAASAAAGGDLVINGSMLNASGVYVVPMTEAAAVRWINPYREDGEAPEAVMLPGMPGTSGTQLRELTVASSNETHVVAAIPRDLVMGSYQIVMWNSTVGAAEMPRRHGSFVNVTAQVLNVQPGVLPASGGMISIAGTGFPTDRARVVLTSSGKPWVVVSANATALKAYSPGMIGASDATLPLLLAQHDGEGCGEQSSSCPPSVTAQFDLQVQGASATVTAVNQTSPGGAVVMTLQAPADSGMSGPDYLTNRTIQVMFGLQQLSVVVDTANLSITIPQEHVAKLPASPMSGHPVYVLIDGNMTSGMQPVVNVTLNISAVSPGNGSMAGGTNLTITGSGFSNMTGETQISICDLPCNVTSVESPSLLYCTTTAPASEAGLLTVRADQVTGTGYSSEQSSSPASLMFDGRTDRDSEWRSSSTSNCEFSVDWYPLKAELTLLRVLIPAELAASSSRYDPKAQLHALTVEVSANATDGSWHNIGNGTSAAPFATGWTEINLADAAMHRYVRVRMPVSSRHCALAEAEFHGRIEPAGGMGNCTVTASVKSRAGTAAAHLHAAYAFSESHTPVVTAVSPAYGTAAGNTTVAINGTNLPATAGDARVMIDGIECAIQSASAEAVVCVTGERGMIPRQRSFVVESRANGLGRAPADAFMYKDRWSSRVTWAGEPPPMDGESIVIPAGQTILYDLPTSPQLRLLLVEGRLEFLDTADLELHAEWIMVRGAMSALTVGREGAPFSHNAVITLHGRRATAREIPSYGAKNIAVRFGTLDLHGVPKTPTWTRLGATAAAGSTTIQLAEAVNWVAGDEIAIASSAWDPSEVEQRRIAAVGSDNMTLTLDHALTYEHYGELVMTEGRTIDMRAEVGCLSRNVKIQGDDESDEDQYGAHIMLASPPRGRLATSIGRISQIECFRCGQAFMLGRYPIHFHMMGDVHDSYIRGAAVHRTFNRAVTLHGVHYLRIEDVVAYDNMGHTFFIEDAIESQNRIVHNLALWTRKSMSLLDTDTTPASFWITFPTNYFYNNSAAGSERYGFWFDLQSNPTGPSHTRDICPPGEPLGAFEDNTAHSNVRYGLRIFNFWVPMGPSRNPCDWSKSWAQSDGRTATLLRYTGYKNGRTGLMMSRAGDVRCVGCSLIDNMRAGAELNRMDAPYGTTGTYDTIIGVKSPAMAGRTFPHGVRDDPDSPRTYGWIVSGFTNEQVVANTTFWGFTGENVYAFSTCDHCNFPNSQNQGAKTTHFANITYNSTENFVFYGSRLNAILHDMDGSLSGYPSGTYMTHSGWPHLTPSCPIGERPGWNTSVVCPMSKRLIRLMVDKPVPFSIYQDTRMAVMHALPPARGTLRPQNKYQDGAPRSMVSWGNKKKKDNPDGWAVVVASDEHYQLWINTTNSVPENLRFEATDMMRTSRAHPGRPESVVVTLPYDDVWPYIGVIGPRGEVEATDLGLVNGSVDRTGDSYRNYENNTLSLLFTGRDNPGRGWWWNEQVTAYGARCPPEGCPPPEAVSVDRTGPLRRWSNRTMWESLPADMRPRLDPATGMPAAGADVSIPASWRIELDSDTPALGHLELDGLLSFERGKDVVLSVQTMKMNVGEIQAGTDTRPHSGKVTLRVAGQQSRGARRLSAVGGSNILDVLGAISMHGTSSHPQSTHLAAPAVPGNTVIIVTDAAQWQPGEEIFLTSTGHSWQAAEYATVASVNGTAVTLREPLRFAHFGASDVFRDAAIGNKTKFEGLENRAQVLLLSRSITIEGGGEDRNGRGAKMLVTELEVEREERGIPITTVYRGSLDVSNVAFRGMGQTGTARAALTVLTTAGTVALHNCTFSHCYGPGVDVRSAELVNMTNNVVLDTEGPAVAVWNDPRRAPGVQVPAAPRAVLVNNTAGFARKLGVDVVKDTVSGFVLCPYSMQCVVQAEGNVAAGSENYGFVFGRASACGVDDAAAMANIAHSCRVGFVYLIPAARQCSRISNAVVHHSTEVGVVYERGGLSLEVEHLLLADNRLGLAAMPGSKRAIDSGSVAVTRSAAVGFSNNGGCGADSTITCPSSCGRAGGFPMYTEGGDAECGPRIGFTASVWFFKPKAWPREPPIMGPWWSIDSDASLGGYTTFQDVALIGWPERDDCGCRHFGITPNPSSDDLMPAAFVSGVHKSNVSAGAEYYTPPADPSRATFDNCVDFECTGLSHAVLVDTDGSLVGAPASVTRGDPNLSIGDDRRSYNALMDAYVIPGGAYRELYFESLDPDRMSRRVQPVAVTGVGAGANRTSTARLNCFEDHLWDFDYTSLLRLSRFATTVELGGAYTIVYAGTPPQLQQLSMSGIAADEGVLVRLKYSVAQTFKVKVKGQRMLLPSLTPVTLADPAGSNHWSMDTFELTVVVKGPQPLLVRQLPMVRISMALQMDVQTFLDTPTATFTTGLANALQLDPSTIRVTGYKARGNRRRRLTQDALDITFAAIPPAELADDPTASTDSASPDADAEDISAEEAEVTVFGAESVRALAEAVALATAAVEQFEIAGVTVETSSLVAEIQEPVAEDCVPTCKTADNGIAPTCTDAVCVCPSASYTYYDATVDGLNATRASGCYTSEVSDPAGDNPADGTPADGATPAGTVSRQAVVVTVRFTERNLSDVTAEVEAALCSVATARIAAVIVDGGSAAVPLACAVTTQSGSVIASARVIVPTGVSSALVTAAAADLTANLAADITQDGVLSGFGAFDAPTAAVTSVDVAAADVVPVIADGVALQPTGDMLLRREGGAVEVHVTFAQNLSNGTIATVDVSGFAADDVVASVTTIPGARVLPVSAAVVQLSGSWYRLRLEPGAWAEEDVRSCEYWTLAVGVTAGAAVSAGGDVSAASAVATLGWRPADDSVCDVAADVDRGVKGTLLAAVLGGVFGGVLLSAIVGIVFARRHCRRTRVGLDDGAGMPEAAV